MTSAFRSPQPKEPKRPQMSELAAKVMYNECKRQEARRGGKGYAALTKAEMDLIRTSRQPSRQLAWHFRITRDQVMAIRAGVKSPTRSSPTMP